MRELASKLANRYDRSVVALIVGLGLIFAFYFKIGDIVDTLIVKSPVIQELKINETIRSVKDESMSKELAEIKQDIRSILREMRRR